MKEFDLQSKYKPTGDQPEAIRQLTNGVLDGTPAQVLLGVTGSGKTFTIANVIKNVGKPTLVLIIKRLRLSCIQNSRDFSLIMP